MQIPMEMQVMSKCECHKTLEGLQNCKLRCWKKGQIARGHCGRRDLVYTWCLIHKFTQCYSSLQCFRSPTAQMPVPQKLQPRLCWHLRVKSRTKWEYESRMIMDNTHFIAFPGSNSSPTFNPTDKGAPAKFSSGVRRLVELELVPWWWLNLNKNRMTVTVHDGWITVGSLEQIGWGVVQ